MKPSCTSWERESAEEFIDFLGGSDAQKYIDRYSLDDSTAQKYLDRDIFGDSNAQKYLDRDIFGDIDAHNISIEIFLVKMMHIISRSRYFW